MSERTLEEAYARRNKLALELEIVEKEIDRHLAMPPDPRPAEAVEIVRRVWELLRQWDEGDRGLSPAGPYRRRAGQLRRVLEGKSR